MARVLQITDKDTGGGGIRRVVEIHQDLLQARHWSCTRLRLGPGGKPGISDRFTAPVRVARHLPEDDPALTVMREAAHGVDVIHLHLGFLSLSPDVITAAARLAPLVVNLHDISPFQDLPITADDEDPPQRPVSWRARLMRRRLRPIRRMLWQRICQDARLILAPSRYLARRAISAGANPGRVQVLPHPAMGRVAIAPAPSQQAPRILYAGLLSEEKGAPLLLEAFAQMKSSGARLVFLGDGPQMASLKSRCKHLGLSAQVQFSGHVCAAQVAVEMAQTRVLAHPSLIAEGFGLVGVEAMQHGRPVVGFGTGGAADWLIHDVTGLIAAPKTANALAASLDRLLADDVLADRLGTAARDHVEKTFSPTVIGDRLAEILAGAAQTTAGARS